MATLERRADRPRPFRVRWSEGSGSNRRYFSRSFARETDARRFKASVEAREHRGPTDRRTVEEAARDWVASRWDDWSANRRQSVDGELRRHILPIIGDVPVVRLSRCHVENVRNARRWGHRSRIRLRPLNAEPADYALSERRAFPAVGPASERKTLSILGSFTKWLVENQQSLERNPSLGVEKREITNATKFGESAKVTEADLPSPQVVRRICDQIERAGYGDLRLVVEAVAFLGLRPQEALALEVSDVVLHPTVSDQPPLSITKALEEAPRRYTRSGTRRNLKGTKNYEIRDVPLSEAYVKAFDQQARAARDRAPGVPPDKVALFARPDGTPITADWFRKQVLNPARRAVGAQGDPRTTLRAMRHLGVTVWLRAFGGDAAQASRFTGHKPDVLLNVYSGIIDKFDSTAAKAHEQAMRAIGAAWSTGIVSKS